jgi:hypothetical protein
MCPELRHNGHKAIVDIAKMLIEDDAFEVAVFVETNLFRHSNGTTRGQASVDGKYCSGGIAGTKRCKENKKVCNLAHVSWPAKRIPA